ncbi:DUF5718 family protein [Vibrio sp. B1FLJ16]|uniref:DUF5718 family protein n=1 Tax=Vibrio sp. B1FLJ16 TaxID=2751178 RepID=UPI0015F57EA8|nr:DUF5718 family protein [Vibrio sp. B1FLJ16]CAD7807013.1 hypothetical protein ACOMICROBIO_EPCKBFOG_01608 [Vibrio sp. B1FLJ16]CAE6904629.1 hypothetical protein ACOMICROBIO_EPCKBFOG_01608 [Vibrio sp. B1FLJ16]
METKQEQIHSIVLGIAGNSPGYLAQTGEISAFSEQLTPEQERAKQQEAQRPRALFPMFVRQLSASYLRDRYLSEMPFSSSKLLLPEESDAKVQIEPEIAIKCGVSYTERGLVAELTPYALTLINDVTYRNKAVNKLAEKKNWGPFSKGIADQDLTIESFSEQSPLEHLRLCGFHSRNGQWQLCSQDVSVTEYNVFYQSLTDWLVETLNQQTDAGALHNTQLLLAQANRPNEITIAIGAPCYTSYGETHQLVEGDQVFICVYDERHFQLIDIETMLSSPRQQWIQEPHIMWLEQTVYKKSV